MTSGASIHRVLIIKPAAVGDILMAYEMVSVLREKYPVINIDWLVGKNHAGILKAIDRNINLLLLDDESLYKGGMKAFWQVIKVNMSLFLNNYNEIYLPVTDWRYSLLVISKLFTKKKKFKKNKIPLAGRYHGHEYRRLVHGVNDSLHIEKLSFLKPVQSGRNHNVLIFPGGGKQSGRDDVLRRWPENNYKTLVKELKARNSEVIIMGSAADNYLIPHFTNLEVKVLIGKTSFAEYLSLVQHARLIICNDSSAMHLARYFETPVLSIFGPTNPYERLPAWQKGKVLWGGSSLPCRPCYDGRDYSKSCKQPDCLKSIKVSDVLALWDSEFSDREVIDVR